MVLAVLALCMQLWAGQATAAHFGQAVVDGTWRDDLCRTENTPGLDPHTLQALCISEHCPACSVAGSKPLPPSAAGILNAAALHNAPPCSDGQNQHSISTRLRPPA